jgi:hypothetical protein
MSGAMKSTSQAKPATTTSTSSIYVSRYMPYSSSVCGVFQECPNQFLQFKNNIINTTLDSVASRLQDVANQTWDATKVIASKIHAFGDVMAGKEEFEVPYTPEYVELGVVISSQSPALFQKMVSVGQTLSKTPLSQRGEVYLKSYI